MFFIYLFYINSKKLAPKLSFFLAYICISKAFNFVAYVCNSKTFKFIVYALLAPELSILLHVHGLMELQSFQICCLSCIIHSRVLNFVTYVCSTRAFKFIAYVLLVVELSIFLLLGVVPKFLVDFLHWFKDSSFSFLCKFYFNSITNFKCYSQS